MLVLGLETSGLQGSIALWRDGELRSRELAREGRRHAQTLTLEIQQLLHECGVTAQQLDGIGVSTGPGSFTGLRVGITCAKTLAYALGKPVVGLETSVVVASSMPEAFRDDVVHGHRRVFFVSDAQRGEWFIGELQWSSGGWTRRGDYRIATGELWLQALDTSSLVIGPAVKTASEAVAHICHDAWSLQPKAEMVARLAVERLSRGEADSAWTLTPLYLRHSAAEEQWQRKQGQG